MAPLLMAILQASKPVLNTRKLDECGQKSLSLLLLVHMYGSQLVSGVTYENYLAAGT